MGIYRQGTKFTITDFCSYNQSCSSRVVELSKLVWKKMLNKVTKSTLIDALVVKLVDTKDLKDKGYSNIIDFVLFVLIGFVGDSLI